MTGSSSASAKHPQAGTIALRPTRRLTHDELAELTGVIDAARSATDVAPPEPDTVRNAQPVRIAAADCLPDGVTTAPVLLRVFGVPRIDGFDIAGSRALELLAYLATHPDGVTRDVLGEALWSGRPPNPRRLTEAVSRTRRTVGELLLPHATDGRYRVSDQFACDATAFAAHLRVAAADPDRTDAELRAALELVTGEPFTATPPGSYDWAHTEGLTTHLVVAVADAAHTLADRALAASDLATARWATAQGLLAAPRDEQLYRDQMRIADARGDASLVHDIMGRLRTSIDDDTIGPDADDQLHPATLELYSQLAPPRPWSKVAPAGEVLVTYPSKITILLGSVSLTNCQRLRSATPPRL